ncbi:MYG1 family protein, partial [Candidatus Woesearchaeota archaeon]
PKEWAGSDAQTLAKLTGVQDAVFCHRNLFIAAAKSKQGALKLAKLALEN